MKVLKIVLLVIGCIILVLIILFLIYLWMNKQGVIESSEIGNPELEHRVLIASQGSGFKNALVKGLSTNLEQRQIYIKVLDVTVLSGVSEKDWDAVVLIHTTEMSKVQPDVKAFLDRAHDLDKVILITTSGPGTWKTDDYDVDIITSASKKEELLGLTEDILRRLDVLLSN
jgi:hypothetical protein